MSEHGNAEQLAAKLADAGPEDDEALAWVREVQAAAWDEGYIAADNGRDESENPYRMHAEER